MPYLPPNVSYLRGQRELGAGGFDHWQLLVLFKRSVRLAAVRSVFGPVHCELSRSEAADQYVWKQDTRIEGTQFELGVRPFRRQAKRDWDQVRDLAKQGNIEAIDASVYVCHYRTLKQIAVDHLEPIAIERVVHVFWGPTGTGKSRRAWDEAGFHAYPKDPRSKFWDGYRGQEHVVLDEFRGAIDVAHLLRWFDRYPVIVEVKGSSVVFNARVIWVTSNLDPRMWYPDLDPETLAALLRRLNIVHFDAFQ